MTPFQKEALHFLSGPYQDIASKCAPFLWQVYRHKRCDQILAWLLEHRIGGKDLLAFINGPCKGSFLLTIANVIARIDGEKVVKPLFVKDFN